jgi:eukaryotic-like serine/threonine-protein kinase
MTERDLFLAAFDIADPVERSQFIKENEADPVVRQRVEELIKAHLAAGSFLDSAPAHDATGAFASSPEATADHGADQGAGTVIAGRYTLLEKIGEGGMGEVWVAKQSEPVKRRVALKLIKAGMDSKSVIQRFEQERQALAMMDHPNIARILDGGLTEDRRPFFVMELVNGLALTKFCDEAKLGIRERLELFVPICQAVQHAHQKAIVHRDLKPSNILVTIVDGRPVPKIIDFGVAKATGGKLTDESMSTQFGAVIGTLEYMSPEQAGFAGVDIDTRADIYSLGVILYELLTGLRPFDAKRLKKVAFDEMIRMIREDEPSKPSTRLSTDESLPSLAAVRQMEPRRLTKLLRGELDWVVMKCLEKQRDRRYETANALGRDVQRYLADEAIEARPPSAGYRLRKFVKRHKGRVVAASIVFLALVGGIVGATWGLVRALDAENKARSEQQQAEKDRDAKEEARRNESIARIEATDQELITEAVNQFMLDDVLGSVDAQSQERRGFRPVPNLTVRQAVERAASQVGARFKDRPAVEAAVRLAIGRALSQMDEDAKAIVHLERARELYQQLGTLDSDRGILCMVTLARCYLVEERRDEAFKAHQYAYDRSVAKYGADHPKSLVELSELAHCANDSERTREAIKVLEGALARLKSQATPNLPDIHLCTSTLSDLYNLDQQYEKALALDRENLAFAIKHHGLERSETVTARGNLGLSLQLTDKYAEAVEEYREALRVSVLLNGPDDRDALHRVSSYGQALALAGQHDEAWKVLTEALKRSEAKHGRLNAATLQILSQLATSGSKGVEESIRLEEDICGRYKEKFGAASSRTFLHAQNLWRLYQHTKQHDKAIRLVDEVYKATEAERGPNHRRTVTVLGELVAAYAKADRMKEGEPLAQLYIERGGKAIAVIESLGVHLLNTRRHEQAIPHLEKLLAHERASPKTPPLRLILGPAWITEQPRRLHRALELLAEAHFRAEHINQALPLFRELTDFTRKAFVPGSIELLNALDRLAGCHNFKKDWPAAIAARREFITAFGDRKDKKQPAELRYQLARMHMVLGEEHFQSREEDESEKALREAISLLKQLNADEHNSLEYLTNEADTRLNLGRMLLRRKKPDEAIVEFKPARDLFVKLAAELPDKLGYQEALAELGPQLSKHYLAQRKPKEALVELRIAQEALERLLIPDPKNPGRLRALAGVLSNQEEIYLVFLKQPREAEMAGEQAKKIYLELHDKFPDDFQIAINLCGSYCNIGNALSQQRMDDKAIEQFSTAIKLLDALHPEKPQQEATRRQFLRNSHRLRGVVYKRIKSYPEAVADWDKAVELETNPNLRLHLLTMRALCRARTDSALAVNEADSLRQTKGISGLLLYDVACVYAVVHSRSTDAAERARLATKTIETLQEAQRLGYFAVKPRIDPFKTDPDFDSLRDHPDFQKFQKEIGIDPAPKRELLPPPREWKR